MQSETFAEALLYPDAGLPVGIKGEVPRRFSVYRNNVVLGLVRAMESNFPAILRLLGPAYFQGLAREYVLANPPRSPLMFEFGESFPEYLAAQTDLAVFPYLADVAKLECLMRLAYHDEDSASLSPDSLSAINSDVLGKTRLQPHPTLHLLASGFAAVSITEANRSVNFVQVANPAVPEWAIVSRPVFDVVLTSVPEAQFIFVQGLAEGCSFAAATDAAFDIDENFDLASNLAQVLSLGLFRSIMN